MAKREDENFGEKEEKAAYNQSANITEFLGNLLGGYIVNMKIAEYKRALDDIDRIMDIISAKVKPNEMEVADEMVKDIESYIGDATEVYINKTKGIKYLKSPTLNIKLRDAIRTLFRYVNKLQDKYGYGMVSLDDPRMAVLQR